jgi:hypothetical protein
MMGSIDVFPQGATYSFAQGYARSTKCCNVVPLVISAIIFYERFFELP